MTPADINRAMPLGQPMSTYDIQRALEHITGRPLLPNAVSSTLKLYREQIIGGGKTTRWQQWTRIADIPDPAETRAKYPCEVRFEEREVPLMTKSTGSMVVRVTLPKEPWCKA